MGSAKIIHTFTTHYMLLKDYRRTYVKLTAVTVLFSACREGLTLSVKGPVSG